MRNPNLPDADTDLDVTLPLGARSGSVRVAMTRPMAHERIWALCEARALLQQQERKATRLGRHESAAALKRYADALTSLADMMHTALYSDGVHVEIPPLPTVKLSTVSSVA